MKPLRAKMLRYTERRGYSALTVINAQHYGKTIRYCLWVLPFKYRPRFYLFEGAVMLLKS